MFKNLKIINVITNRVYLYGTFKHNRLIQTADIIFALIFFFYIYFYLYYDADRDGSTLMHMRAGTNLPSRHSGVRPQHDPTIKLYGDNGCLQTKTHSDSSCVQNSFRQTCSSNIPVCATRSETVQLSNSSPSFL